MATTKPVLCIPTPNREVIVGNGEKLVERLLNELGLNWQYEPWIYLLRKQGYGKDFNPDFWIKPQAGRPGFHIEVTRAKHPRKTIKIEGLWSAYRRPTLLVDRDLHDKLESGGAELLLEKIEEMLAQRFQGYRAELVAA